MKKIIRNTIMLTVLIAAVVLLSYSKLDANATAATGIAGDANADQEVNVKDLVRTKRFAKQLEDQVTDRLFISEDIDLDRNRDIGDIDTRYLRILLVGEYKASTVTDKVRVGKYDNEAGTFDIRIPETMRPDEDATLADATIEYEEQARTTSFREKTYSDGKVTLSSTPIRELHSDEVHLVFETGSARVDVISIPIDGFTMVINDETELNYFPTVAQQYPTGYYILGNDIYCKGTYTSNHNVTFMGTFDGMLHTIYDMKIVCGANEYGGFFGRNFGDWSLDTTETLKYISFVNAEYSGMGGFLASQIGGTMQDVYIDITMKNCGTGANIESSAVLGTNTYGALRIKNVLINYREPLPAGATTGTAVYEMHTNQNSYDGLYVIGANNVHVADGLTGDGIHNCAAYFTENDFYNAVSNGNLTYEGWEDGFWNCGVGPVPVPVNLSPYKDTVLEKGVLADFTEPEYRNNVKTGRAVQSPAAQAEVLDAYTDVGNVTEEKVLAITPAPNIAGKFDFSLYFGEKIAYSQIESISIRIAQTNVNSPTVGLQTFFVTSNTEGGDIWESDGRYAIYNVPEDTWSTIEIPLSVLAHAQDEDGCISSLSFFCDNGRVDTTKSAVVYVDEVTCTLKEPYPEQAMYLGAFSSPLPNPESYQECADAGFNYILMDEDFDNYRGSETQKKTLEYCNRAGLNAIVMALNYQNTENTTVDNTDYTQFPAYAGSFYWDEPYPKHFEQIAKAANEYQEKYPDKMFMVNLHPCTIFEKTFNPDLWVGFDRYDYEQYLSTFKSNVLDKLNGKKMLSVDIYPLLADGQILEKYLYNLEATAKLARGTDLMTHYYILTHGPSAYRNITSIADIKYQYNTAMAYGVQGFSCFTYKQQQSEDYKGHDALINWAVDENGQLTKNEKTAIYYYVKEANGYLRALEDVYLAFEWQKTMAIEGSSDNETNACYAKLTENQTELDGISSVTATQDTLIGYFLDDNGTKGYMVTNFTEPSKGLTDTVELNVTNASNVRIYQNGEMKELKPKNGKVTLSLEAGGGVFVLVI